MLIRSKLRRTLAGAVIAAAGLTALGAQPAMSHVTVTPQEVPAEGYAKLDFSVGHGCEASPTTSISIQMPDQVVAATPQVAPGWKIKTKEGELAKPVESHGETVTTGVREVTWSGGPLDPHHLAVFGLSVRLAGEPGDEVPFKVVQRCEQGEAAWIELPGTDGQEPEFPAPIVTLTAAEDDHGHSHEGDEAAHDAAVDADQADGEEQAGEVEDESTSGSDGPLPIIALVIAVVALVVALLNRRRGGK